MRERVQKDGPVLFIHELLRLKTWHAPKMQARGLHCFCKMARLEGHLTDHFARVSPMTPVCVQHLLSSVLVALQLLCNALRLLF